MSVDVTKLPSGLTVITDAMPHLETAALGVWAGVGGRDEKPNEHGISHLLEHMAFKGTTRRSSREIVEEIEAVGGDLNAGTSTETTAYYARVMKADVPLALDVLSDVLSTGRSSRFNQVIVREKQLATNANAGAQDSRGPGLFEVSATVAPGKTAADVEAALYDEIEKVKAGPIADWEIEKAHNGARRNQAGAATSTLTRAIQLGEYALFYNDPNLINTRTGKILKVTAADVQRVAAKYLTKENRSVITTAPKPAAAKGGQQ